MNMQLELGIEQKQTEYDRAVIVLRPKTDEAILWLQNNGDEEPQEVYRYSDWRVAHTVAKQRADFVIMHTVFEEGEIR